MNQNIKYQAEADPRNQQTDNVQGVPTFLSKTYDILENSNYYDIISWTKNGEGFVVKKVKQFSEKILPLHFRHSNYSSFVRQLNMYDFHKMRQDNQENAFKNVLFRRGNKILLKDIQRKDYKKTKQQRVHNNSTHHFASKNDLNEDQNNLIKEINCELAINAQFSKRLQRNAETARLEMVKCEESCSELAVQLNGDLNNELAYFENSKSNCQHDAEACRLIDHIHQLKKMNSKIRQSIQLICDDWDNYLSKKYLKWNSLLNHESSVEDKKQLQFPTWASSNMTLPLHCASHRYLESVEN